MDSHRCQEKDYFCPAAAFLTGMLRNTSKVFLVHLDCTEVQLAPSFCISLSKELNHLQIACCLLSLFNFLLCNIHMVAFPSFMYVSHTGEEGEKNTKSNHASDGTLPFPVLKRTPPRKILLDSDSLSHTVNSKQTLRISLEFKPLKAKV